ncbi:hypothetical protein PZM28_13355 [Staphylococcus aureus]|nr:hypothetical protein [Staphylococcus aureus]MDH9769548.1 hypothetical protein [Staphylococcus aureus]MDH9772187.1 hypothetical protein [Staphylococcus aureus]MDH9774696.1 hypothetical protein [Staphylococcus aureus]MDH9788994.1 hypothetical protein [Staphylococcus aureus]
MQTKFAGLSNQFTKELSNSYSFKDWRDFNKESQKNFAIIPSAILSYLSEFDNKALSLYLYYCLHARNDKGESWHSTNKCANELGVTVRSINNWNNVLERMGLIFRESNNHSSLSTFLLPISNYISVFQNTKLDEYLKKYSEDILQSKFEGSLKAVINVFQYRKNYETKEFTEPYNVWLLIFERKYNTDSKKFVVNKYVVLENTEIEGQLNVSSEEIENDLYRNKDDGFKVLDYVRKNNITLDSNIITGEVIINSKYDLKLSAKDSDKRARAYELLLTLFDDLNEFRDRMGEIDYAE